MSPSPSVPHPNAPVDPRIKRYLQTSGLAARGATVISLTGDASDRRYFRVLVPGARSLVLALHTGAIDLATLPFANVAELFHAMAVPAPAITGASPADGILVLEDLGDETLQAHLAAAPAGERARRYREAMAIIVAMQTRGAELASPRFLPYGLAFDVEKLTFELNFFVTHFLEGSRRASIGPAERDALAEEWAAITGALASEPRVLCHRDYHSRNLMLHDGRLYVIDFQDARMGPDTYDLVSLLRDSYVTLADAEVDACIADFIAAKAAAGTRDGASGLDATRFRRRFDLMAVQRNLKALGTFGFQATARGNASYLRYVPATLGYVRANLENDPRFARLRSLLAPFVEELG